MWQSERNKSYNNVSSVMCDVCNCKTWKEHVKRTEKDRCLQEKERKRQMRGLPFVSKGLGVKTNGKCQHTHYRRKIQHNKTAWSTKGRLLASDYVAISSHIDPPLPAKQRYWLQIENCSAWAVHIYLLSIQVKRPLYHSYNVSVNRTRATSFDLLLLF